MIKDVHLAFFINEYNKEPIWTDLITFKDVNELDHFMDYFYNNNENIRKLFNEDIGEYSLDNIGQFKKMNEIINGNFKGRISAYYYNSNGQMEFIDLPTPKKKPIRDYHKIEDFETAYEYLSNVFDEAVKRINEKYKKYGPTMGEFLHHICEKLHQASYEVSKNELNYLIKYYKQQNNKNRSDCLTLLRTNVRRYYLEKAQKKHEDELKKLGIETKEPEISAPTIDASIYMDNDLYELARELAKPEKEKLAPLDSASKKLEYDIERTLDTKDYDNLYLNHDLDELIRDTNVGKGMK